MSDQAKQAKTLFSKPCDFVLGAASLSDIPATRLPEIAFIGRSNVGKSSLINALTNRKDLARTSNTPGRTQQLNFFNLNEQLMLVDLPGYGYAKASKQSRAEWNSLIGHYLRGRAQLQRVCVLIDSRHGLKSSDLEMMEMLDIHAVSYQLVLTKIDKIKATEKETVLQSLLAVAKDHPAMYPEIMVTSSVKREGVSELQTELYGFVKHDGN